MTKDERSVLRTYLPTLLYILALLFLLGPFLNLLGQLLPLDFSSPEWRFGALGLVAQNMVIFVLGAGVALLAAHLAGHGRIQVVLGGSCLALSLLFLLGSGIHFFEGIQLREGVPVDSVAGYNRHLGSGLFFLIAGGGSFLVMGRGGIRLKPPNRGSVDGP